MGTMTTILRHPSPITDRSHYPVTLTTTPHFKANNCMRRNRTEDIMYAYKIEHGPKRRRGTKINIKEKDIDYRKSCKGKEKEE